MILFQTLAQFNTDVLKLAAHPRAEDVNSLKVITAQLNGLALRARTSVCSRHCQKEKTLPLSVVLQNKGRPAMPTPIRMQKVCCFAFSCKYFYLLYICCRNVRLTDPKTHAIGRKMHAFDSLDNVWSPIVHSFCSARY